MTRRPWPCVVLFFALAGCTSNSDRQDILIGQFGAFTGPEATFGLATDRGVRLAIDRRNALGGVRGRRVRLLSEDNQGKAEDTVVLVRKLASQQVLGLIGEVASTRSIAAASIAQRVPLPMISPSSTNPDVTRGRSFVFRATFVDRVQGVTLARFAREDLKMKRVAILADVKSDYSLGLTKYFGEEFRRRGGEIAATVDYASNDPEFKAQLIKIRALSPDGLFVPGYYNDLGIIARQAKELELGVKMIGGDGWGDAKLLELANGGAEGAYFTDVFSRESSDPAVKSYIAAFRARYGVPSDPLAASGYDATNIMLDAIARAPKLDPQTIRDEIAKTKGYSGATGTTIEFDEENNAVKDVFIVRIQGDEYKLVKTYTK